MLDLFFDFLQNGLLDMSWWSILAYALLSTHLTIVCVTVFLHRAQAHRALELHPIISHILRFWLWLTTGMITREWVAIHRKHHAKCESPDDPHSPVIVGLKKVMLEGTELYRTEAQNSETISRYGCGTPDDWLERNLYTKRSRLGITLLMILNVLCLGAIGASVWAVQMIWIPFFAAGVINGVGHAIGYRNYGCDDNSRNVFPWGIIIGGEELHNNHHTYPTSAKLSSRWFEFDIGWMYIRLMEPLGLATKVRHPPVLVEGKQVRQELDLDVLNAVIRNRHELMAGYVSILRDSFKREASEDGASSQKRSALLEACRWLHLADFSANSKAVNSLERARKNSQLADRMLEFREELVALWKHSSATREYLVTHLNEWCKNAEDSGIEALSEFSMRMRRLNVSAAAAV